MTKVKVVGVKTLETGKFNADKAEWTNPPKATVKWSEDTPLIEAAVFNNQEAILMSIKEYEALTSGKNYLIPVEFLEGLKMIASMILDLIKTCEKEEKKE